jgi:hypothetical protein
MFKNLKFLGVFVSSATLLRAPRPMVAPDERTPLTAPPRGGSHLASAGKLGEGYSAGQAIWTAGLATCVALVLIILLGVYGKAAACVDCSTSSTPSRNKPFHTLDSFISSEWGCRRATVRSQRCVVTKASRYSSAQNIFLLDRHYRESLLAQEMRMQDALGDGRGGQ